MIVERRKASNSALEQFQGHYADVFRINSDVAIDDATNLVTVLEDLAGEVINAQEVAEAERKRRQTALDWESNGESHNGFHKGWDDFWYNDENGAPVIGAEQVPVKQPNEIHVITREQPQKGPAGSVTSANPDALRSFATTAGQLYDDSLTKGMTFQGAVSDYVTFCSWAPINVDDVLSSIGTYLSNEYTDVEWSLELARQFEFYGGAGCMSSVADTALESALRNAGIREGREPVAVTAAQFLGDPQSSGYADDPVNTTTGNFIEPESDLSFGGASADLDFRRMYNSVNIAVGALGLGWSSIADSRLSVTKEAAAWTTDTGREVTFARLGTGFDQATGENLWLTEAPNSDERWIIRNNRGGQWTFDSAGHPRTQGTVADVQLSYEWEGEQLARIIHRRGRWIALNWATNGERLEGLTGSDGCQVNYSYDSAGRLIAASVEGSTRSYEWNEQGLITRVIDADGVVEVDNTYNDQAQVVTQKSAHGRISRYGYLSGGITVVSDEDGSRSNTWIHDAKGRLVGAVGADDHRQSTAWDRHNNMVMVTDRGGAATVYEYDKRGHCTTEVRATGARVITDYDELDRVTGVTVRADGQESHTAMVYADDARNPSEITDPLGGITRLTWTDGLLTRVVDATGVPLDLSYDEFGDLAATTNAHGDTARLERDATGRTIAAITPMGARTEYRYSSQGQLASRQDPDGAIWHYEYTDAGRMSATIDPTGARTEVEYGDNGLESATIDPLGRTMATKYDDLGNVACSTLPDGSTWKFGFDGLSRLTNWSDVTGSEVELRYDVNGNVVGSTDPTGIEQSFERDSSGLPLRATDPESSVAATRDQLGRVIEQLSPDGSTVNFRYDLAGNLIEQTDSSGRSTHIERDLAGRPLSIRQPGGRSFSYEYDDAGRWSATISTGGKRYEMVYDADGRIAAEHWPDGGEVTTRFDACGRILERTEPGRGITRFSYDNMGRIVSVRDAWDGHRRFRYDKAGQMTAAINPLGGVTGFEYNSLGQLVTITDPLGGVTRREFDALGRLLALTDPNGRTTRYEYDAAGRPTARIAPDGKELAWTYDNAGHSADTLADGKLLSSIKRDVTGRALSLTRGTHTDHLTWDEVGNLISHDRDGNVTRWTWDLDSNRTGLSRPDGTSTSYGYDADHRLAWIEHPTLGRATLSRDALGRLVAVDAEGLHASWTWRDGQVASHRSERNGFISATELERDESGRVTAQVVDGLRTEFSYDEANQLVGSVNSEGLECVWTWDAGGRLVAETIDGATTRHSYDAAGQLVASTGPDGSTGGLRL